MGHVQNCPQQTQRYFVRHVVPTVMAMNNTVLWDATSPTEFTQTFWGKMEAAHASERMVPICQITWH
jgi:hypothetical protein